MIIPRIMEVPSNKPSSLRILTPSSFGGASPSGLTTADDDGSNGWQVGGKGLPSSFIVPVYNSYLCSLKCCSLKKFDAVVKKVFVFYKWWKQTNSAFFVHFDKAIFKFKAILVYWNVYRKQVWTSTSSETTLTGNWGECGLAKLSACPVQSRSRNR